MAKPVKKRSYSSTIRGEHAAQTRARILDAAQDLFEVDGYGRTTVTGIARAAGVAPDTIYKTFGSKGRVLTALIDRSLAPDADAANVLDRPEAVAVHDEPDPRRLIHRFAHDMADVGSRVRPIYEILRTASSVEPEMAAVRAEMDGYRLRNMRTVAGWIAARTPLLVDVDRAAEIIWALASPDVGRMLCEGRGWSSHDYGEWLAATLEATLLPPATPAQATTPARPRSPRRSS